MKEYKRLTNNNLEEYDPEYAFCIGCEYFGEPNGCNRQNGSCGNYDQFIELYNRLAELEDKIENGLLVELPCKVGDTVYWVMDMNIFTYKVKGFSYNCNDDMGLRLILQEMEPSVSFYLGKRLFFAKTEAEARLKELQKDRFFGKTTL